MQRISKIMSVGLIALFLVAACVPSNQAQPSTDSGAVTVKEESVVTEQTADEVAGADSESADLVAAPILTAPTEDITLIGATGRPQFLNSYADW